MVIGIFLSMISFAFIYYQIWNIENNKANIFSLYASLSMSDISIIYDRSLRYLDALKGNDSRLYVGMSPGNGKV